MLGRLLDREVEDIVGVLVKKAGEVSNAGRETFLAAEADRALTEMGRNVSEARAISALIVASGHKSAAARLKVASHLDEVVENVGQAFAASQLLDKVSPHPPNCLLRKEPVPLLQLKVCPLFLPHLDDASGCRSSTQKSVYESLHTRK